MKLGTAQEEEDAKVLNFTCLIGKLKTDDGYKAVRTHQDVSV